jgi:hypothetical protein
VNDAERVGLGDRLTRLEHVTRRELHGQRAPALKDTRQVLAVHEFHDHVWRTRRQRPHVDDARHVLGVDLGRRLRFACKSRNHVWVRRGLRQEELEGDALVELDVHRRHDDAHPSLTEDSVDSVLPRNDVPLVDSCGYLGNPVTHVRRRSLRSSDQEQLRSFHLIREIVGSQGCAEVSWLATGDATR